MLLPEALNLSLMAGLLACPNATGLLIRGKQTMALVGSALIMGLQ